MNEKKIKCEWTNEKQRSKMTEAKEGTKTKKRERTNMKIT